MVALAAAFAAVAARWLIDRWLDQTLALVTLPAAVAVTVWLAGPLPALVTTVVGYLACDWLFLGSTHAFGPYDTSAVVGACAFLVSCSILIAFGTLARNARGQARERAEQLRITLACIGDAVVTTDAQCRVDYMNAVAEALTGWTRAQAAGRPLHEVFRIVNEDTRAPVENPAERALREGLVVGLANHTVLLARDGSERPIDDSAAPIRDRQGRIVGCVLVFRDVAERRASELALRQSEGELADFFENATIAIQSIGPDGTVLRANRAQLELLGYAADDYVGRPAAPHFEDPALVEDMLARLQRGESVEREPARLLRRDGTTRDVLISSSGLFRDGVFVHSRCFALDVTEVRRAQRSLALLAAIVSDSDDAIVSKTLDGTILSWNAGAERVFGYPPEEAVGRSIDLIIPSELREEERSILERLRRGERIDHFETTRVAKDGRRLSISLTVSPIRDESGRVVGASKIARDVTAHKESESLLRESETRFRVVADNAPILMWLDDAHGCTFVNRSYREYLGLAELPEGSVLDWTPYVHPDDRAAYLDAYARAQAEGTPFHAEFRFLRHDGEYRWMESSGLPRFGRGGELLGFVGCTYDIHDARAAASALRAMDRRKDEFLATLAHELRNPLAPIANALEIVRRAEDDRDALRLALDTIERQLRHMVRLVDDLLDVSRITRDRLELRRARVELGPIVQQAVETWRALAQEEGLALHALLPAEPLWLDADPVRLAQVFANLVHNACKYTPRGGTITVRARAEGDEVEVGVRDDGIGIPREQLEAIFEMFSQADPAQERSRGGLGIGLTLVRRLVAMHGGRVTAHSEGHGRGSELVVRLPRAAGPAAAPPDAPAASAGARRCRRILVVDDNHDHAASLALLLRMSGHDAREAHDGPQALDEAERFRPEVVLLDIGLPGLDGLETCRRLRAREWAGELRLFALTGWGQEEDRRRSREAGFDDHLVKPIDHAQLLRLLEAPPAERA